ncbi:hypothetical protein SEA_WILLIAMBOONE_15 [Gordonia phage WilliamBoone]|nr:hypothetical protein SEA_WILLIAMBOONE_15 [Gordonia phage WilliamBoone]
MIQRFEWTEIADEVTGDEPQGYRTTEGPVLVQLVDRLSAGFSDEVTRVYRVVFASGVVKHYRVGGWRDSYEAEFNVDTVTEVTPREVIAYEWEDA